MKLKEENCSSRSKLKRALRRDRKKGYTNDLQHREMVKDVSTK